MKTILLLSILLCFCACKQEPNPSMNDQFIGTYEGVRTEYFKYDSDYLGKDTTVLDTQQQIFLWKIVKAKGDTLLIDNKRFVPSAQAQFRHLNVYDDPYGSFLIEDSQIWFFLEKDSFYMETILPIDIVAGVTRVDAVISTGKRID